MLTIEKPIGKRRETKGDEIYSGVIFEGTIGAFTGIFLRAGTKECGVIVLLDPIDNGGLSIYWSWNKAIQAPPVTIYRTFDAKMTLTPIGERY